MIKKSLSLFLCILAMSGCTSGFSGEKPKAYEKYQVEFFDLFDTHTTITGYAKSETEFEAMVSRLYERLADLHRKFDIYHEYEGIANLCTINKNAASAPVRADGEIISLLLKAKEAYSLSHGTVNIALGPVLSIWHTYRTESLYNEMAAKLPPMEQLKEAAKNINIHDLVINEHKQTVYFQKPGMALNVGAVAKGYAAYLAGEDVKAAGLKSAVIDLGGNVVTIGQPMDNVRDRWGIGIRNPALDSEDTSNILDVIYVNDMAAVTSGDYQRFYMVDGKRYNHIIDPSTLMPADRYSAVTVVHPDSMIADALSTALFMLPIDVGKEIAAASQADAIWVLPDGSIEATDGYRAISKNLGNYSAVDS